MAEEIVLTEGLSRVERYQELFPQIKAVIEDEPDMTANLANICAMLKEGLNFLWIGFYRKVESKQELVLGPFQGPLACTRIQWGKGVCGTAAKDQTTIIVPNVHEFPGHIACSSLSQSEIVVPLVNQGKTQLVLDIDSASLDDFSTEDAQALEKLMDLIKTHHFLR